MDDYSLSSLGESKNEWSARLVYVLTPSVIQGIKSIFDEAWKLCRDNNELDKYLMTFQTFLTRVPKWNATIISTERQRIVETSGCSYLEDLITCVHVIQLKALSCVRVGKKQKKVDIDVPSVDAFIHKVYINVARKIYTNIYLFETNIPPLKIQKNNNALENIIKECILNSLRESVPVENILRAYMDETEEQDVQVSEEIEKVELTPEELATLKKDAVETATTEAATESTTAEATTDATATADTTATNTDPDESTASSKKTDISFSDIDKAMDVSGKEEDVLAPKTEERLEQISELAYEKRKKEEEEDDDADADEKLVIGGDIELKLNDINEITKPSSSSSLHLNDPPLLEGVEVLY